MILELFSWLEIMGVQLLQLFKMLTRNLHFLSFVHFCIYLGQYFFLEKIILHSRFRFYNKSFHIDLVSPLKKIWTKPTTTKGRYTKKSIFLLLFMRNFRTSITKDLRHLSDPWENSDPWESIPLKKEIRDSFV